MASGDAASPTATPSPAPSSVGSPCPTLAPRSSQPLPKLAENPWIITQKEWVIPPRPKPGRKPATDTPPTKRKAQNRAAQRAFRERRAARISELEDKLKDVTTEAASKNQEFKDQLAQLTKNNLELVSANEAYRNELESLRQQLQEARASKSEMTQVASPAPSAATVSAPCGGDCSCSAAEKAVCGDRNMGSFSLTRRDEPGNEDPPLELIGCGNCTQDTECACFNEATTVSLSKRSPSPISKDPKRARLNESLNEMETDFTNAFMPSTRTSSRRSARMPDPCGFCSDGTPCVCAEMANAMDMDDSEEDGGYRSIRLAPILRNTGLGMLSPPSSSSGESAPLRRIAEFTRPVPLYPLPGVRASTKPTSNPSSSAPAPGGCKPGGCDQCKSDPMSTLFCQSVATRVGEAASKSGGCCGGNAGGGGCCKDIEAAVATNRRSTRSSKKVEETVENKTYIPCSAAYQALSRHRAFDEAAADLGALVRPLKIQSVHGDCPQVEVNSVRDVLKMLDRRFGRD